MRVGLAIFAVIGGAALLSVVWTPYPVNVVDIAARFSPASLDHPLGTDQYGRDVASMLMAGSATSLGVAGAAVAIGLFGGIPLGLASAIGPAILDRAIMRFCDLTFAFPALITAALIAAIIGPSAAGAALAIGVFNVPVFARLSAATARSLVVMDFVAVARLAGKGRARIALEHVLPNALPVLLTQAATQFAVAILAEAGLSYVGLGAQPPTVSWGRMLAEAQTLITLSPALAVWPGLAIAASVLSVVTIGERLRKRLDPRLAPAAGLLPE